MQKELMPEGNTLATFSASPKNYLYAGKLQCMSWWAQAVSDGRPFTRGWFCGKTILVR